MLGGAPLQFREKPNYDFLKLPFNRWDYGEKGTFLITYISANAFLLVSDYFDNKK